MKRDGRSSRRRANRPFDRKQEKPPFAAALALFLATVAVGGMFMFAVDRGALGLGAASGAAASAETPLVQARFDRCRARRETCVVDGDTFWLHGEKIRVADIDTPEVGSPQCQREYALGMAATDRLIELLNEGPFEIRASGARDQDIYGRSLRIVVRHGESIGDSLVREKLARRWTGHRQPWC